MIENKAIFGFSQSVCQRVCFVFVEPRRLPSNMQTDLPPPGSRKRRRPAPTHEQQPVGVLQPVERTWPCKTLKVSPLRPDSLVHLRDIAAGLLQCVDMHYVCICGLRFQNRNAALRCCTAHSVNDAQCLYDAALYDYSEGVGGKWLSEGESCPQCGSLDGGWVCLGSHGHLHPCCEAMPTKRIHIDVFDENFHVCVHGHAGGRGASAGELGRVIEHLQAHGKAANAFTDQIQKIMR